MGAAFGNAIVARTLAVDVAVLAPASFRERHGDAFLLVHSLDIGRPGSDTSATGVATDKLRQAADASVEASRTRPSASGNGTPAVLVYPVKRLASSKFDWIAVGRHEGNDIVIPHKSISRFHAFFRVSTNGFLLQDAKSQNGTFLGGVRVARVGEGEGIEVKSGALLRFGEVPATFLTAASLCAVLKQGSERR